MIPGSHLGGALTHDISVDDEHNVLYQNQTVHGIDQENAVYCTLEPGRHHRSNNRRIGLNIQYIAPHVRQTKLPGYSALLVRGEDRFHHYEEETRQPATLIRRHWHGASKKTSCICVLRVLPDEITNCSTLSLQNRVCRPHSRFSCPLVGS